MVATMTVGICNHFEHLESLCSGPSALYNIFFLLNVSVNWEIILLFLHVDICAETNLTSNDPLYTRNFQVYTILF